MRIQDGWREKVNFIKRGKHVRKDEEKSLNGTKTLLRKYTEIRHTDTLGGGITARHKWLTLNDLKGNRRVSENIVRSIAIMDIDANSNRKTQIQTT